MVSMSKVCGCLGNQSSHKAVERVRKIWWILSLVLSGLNEVEYPIIHLYMDKWGSCNIYQMNHSIINRSYCLQNTIDLTSTIFFDPSALPSRMSGLTLPGVILFMHDFIRQIKWDVSNLMEFNAIYIYLMANFISYLDSPAIPPFASRSTNVFLCAWCWFLEAMYIKFTFWHSVPLSMITSLLVLEKRMKLRKMITSVTS